MPARDLLRRPGRTLTTMLSLAVVITILLAVLGILDSVSATSGAARREMLGNTPTRTIVTLDHLYPQEAPRLKTISSLRAVGGVQASLRITGTLRNGRHSVPAIVELIDSRAALWRPTIQAGSELAPGTPGILISAKAASDLGTGPGKAISFVYFRPAGDSSFTLAKASIRVLGIHRNPIRTFAFLDASQAKVLGYGGRVNTLSVVAAHDVSQGALERALFSRPGVLSVEPASAVPDVSRDRLNDFLSIFHVVEAIALGLALLIAFNSTSISAEERARDHATMFAFGLPVRAVVAVAAAESFLIGLLGTAIAIVPGYVLLGWILRNYLEKTYPDLGLLTSISTTSAGVIVLVGVVAVALAPVLTIRALRHMDVPAKLRTSE
jgi:putative ABC transport system permease protein